MGVPPDPIMPTATADQPGQTPTGDYLAPPPMLRMPDSRRLPIALLCALLFFNGVYMLVTLGHISSRNSEWMIDLPISGGLFVLQFLASFKSHKWPTPALWLALAVALAGFFIQIT
jgi:hypothetical protein